MLRHGHCSSASFYFRVCKVSKSSALFWTCTANRVNFYSTASESSSAALLDSPSVRRFLKESHVKHGTVTLDKRVRVSEFFLLYNKMKKNPPWNDLANLSNDLQLNIRQIYKVYEEEASQGKLEMYVKRSRGKITFKTKQLIRHWLRQTNFKNPDENEKLYLSRVCGISLEQLRGQLRRLMDPSGRITDASRRAIRFWYEKNGQTSPNRAQMEELKQLTGLSYFQLREQFRHLKVKHGVVTHEKKQVISQFWKDNDYQMLPPERIRALAQRTKLSVHQIYGQLYQLRNQNENSFVEPRHKKVIFDYADEYQNDLSRTEMLDELERKTGLTRAQISFQLRHWKDVSGTVNQQTKDIVRSWLQDNNFRSPTHEERQQLLTETGWSSSQLSVQLFDLKETNGSITAEKERIIEEWIQLHKRKPKGLEIQQIRDKTNLSRVQIYYLVRKIMDPPGKVTEETKEIVWQWLLKNDGGKPSKTQKGTLLNETGWNLEQLLYQMRQMRQKM
uniref:Uncharacterized protein n=1 Tax=Percolomonas cosmopolitus TaxID=63605 RepID=A0A7S1KU25_9EUKA